jgi:hypothetical protein
VRRHIHFATVAAAQWFASLIGDAAMVHREPGNGADTMCVAFPAAEVDRLESRLVDARFTQ